MQNLKFSGKKDMTNGSNEVSVVNNRGDENIYCYVCLPSVHFLPISPYSHTYFTIAEVAFHAYLRMYDVIAESEPLTQSRVQAPAVTKSCSLPLRLLFLRHRRQRHSLLLLCCCSWFLLHIQCTSSIP